ncbi:hypothetical protein GOP47_0008233 [Adiantum capillus-veneris]|uniref:Uncharacterized protein n=1 Tax=Adiantum capillus-veneris TaxID=13818 RepID=A0A9D4UY61_ADICA|nr:hypothetical protein GOP47_0008233 [Adiantum capillus-veneris]
MRSSMARATGNSENVRMKLAVQADWDNKQFSNALSLHVKRLFEFVLQFESTTKSKLAELNEKLMSLERQLEFLEAQASSVNAGDRED